MRTRERDLIVPALRILAEYAHPERGMTTAELADRLRGQITPTAEDLEMLTNRKDDRLSQVIRNLVSHRTLERRGLAVYHKGAIDGLGYYKLTPMGLRTLNEPPGHTPISK